MESVSRTTVSAPISVSTSTEVTSSLRPRREVTVFTLTTFTSAASTLAAAAIPRWYAPSLARNSGSVCSRRATNETIFSGSEWSRGLTRAQAQESSKSCWHWAWQLHPASKARRASAHSASYVSTKPVCCLFAARCSR
eukprot:974479-Rhodomonas_salina.2